MDEIILERQSSYTKELVLCSCGWCSVAVAGALWMWLVLCGCGWCSVDAAGALLCGCDRCSVDEAGALVHIIEKCFHRIC